MPEIDPKSLRLRVVSNFGDGDCGADEIHTRAPNFEEALPSRRVSTIFRARLCISPAPQSPLPKLETTCSLEKSRNFRETHAAGVLIPYREG